MWEGGGTGPPELAVVARLAQRNHRVDVLGDPTLASDVASSGARFFPWRRAPHRETRAAEGDIVRDWAALTPLGAFARARDRHAFAPAYLFARELVAHFGSRRADVVVVDALLFGALVGAEATRAPFVAMIPMTSFLPAKNRPPSGLGLRPARSRIFSRFGHARDRALYALGDALLWRPCLPHLNRARHEVGLEPIDHPLDQIRRADRVLVQTSAWFDFDAPRENGNVVYTGPELADPPWAQALRAALPRGDAPLVLVAFSTTFMDQTRILRRVIDALAKLPVRALVTTGPALDPHALPSAPNVTVCESASHADVLPHAALVVTHGGHGTVIRALAHGVPLVCMPMGRDQSDNAARAASIGASLSLSRHATTSAIRRTIERALSDDALHLAARHAREIIARENVSDRATSELESLLSFDKVARA